MSSLRFFQPLSVSAHAPRPLRGWAVALLCWLCFAQLCMPLLGKLHDISHLYARALQAAVVATSSASAGERDGSDSVVSPGHGVHDLFGKHSEADCQGFSHMALGAGLLCHALQAPLLRGVQETAPTVLAILLRQSPALFFARGPPSHSPS
ncbi:hypothetical protein HS961_06275 [Comamonas piscis]|uniref:DUF2946 family protein n=1 Tax=Comamonas piscis TaxID=1562974 RepID=A0A7G5EEP8_9BURK|nr:hypothetical protein [Comamonas piscis]QMV72473.1 hypothetical protein HS961_06275 [Comamonas piscis]WSO35243.1 hypothetical protein VUJ63_06300 [Comamonas piscis]